MKVLPERFLTTPYSAHYHQDRNCHVISFLLDLTKMPLFHQGKERLDEGSSHPFFQKERQGHSSMEGPELRDEAIELGEWEKSVCSPNLWESWAGWRDTLLSDQLLGL